MDFGKMTMRERAEWFVRLTSEKFSDRINGMIAPTLVSCDEERREICLGYQPAAWQMNQMDILHGGMVATMFDQTMGTLTRSCMRENRPVVTAELSISYLRQVNPGDGVEVRCQVKSLGRSLVRVYGEMVVKESGVLVATGTSVFAVVNNQ